MTHDEPPAPRTAPPSLPPAGGSPKLVLLYIHQHEIQRHHGDVVADALADESLACLQEKALGLRSPAASTNCPASTKYKARLWRPIRYNRAAAGVGEGWDSSYRAGGLIGAVPLLVLCSLHNDHDRRSGRSLRIMEAAEDIRNKSAIRSLRVVGR